MKFSPIFLILNFVILVVAAVIVIPSLNVDIRGRQISFAGLDRSTLCLKKDYNKDTMQNTYSNCLPDYNYLTSKDFGKQKIYRFEFSDLNAADSKIENKEQVFDRNFEVLKQRFEIIGFNDYSLRKVITEDGKYFVEVALADDGNIELHTTLLNSITVTGNVSIYEDIPNFEPQEDDQSAFNFTQGKTPSDGLSLDDVVRVSNYLHTDSFTQFKGYVIRLDFTDESKEAIQVAADAITTTKAQFKGIQLVQNGFPIAVQAAPIPAATNFDNGQNYILFTSLFDPQNRLLSRAIASVISTDPLSTTIKLESTFDAAPEFGTKAVEYLKIALPVVVLIMFVALALAYKKLGVYVGAMIAAQALIGFAVAKLVTTILDGSYTIGAIGGIMFGLAMLYPLFRNKSKNFEIKNFHSDIRKYYWQYTIIIFATIIIWTQTVASVFLAPLYGLVIFIIAFAYVLELVMLPVANIFFKK